VEIADCLAFGWTRAGTTGHSSTRILDERDGIEEEFRKVVFSAYMYHISLLVRAVICRSGRVETSTSILDANGSAGCVQRPGLQRKTIPVFRSIL
jgi:hypothetical protein